MHAALCSVRALELCVRDLTAVGLRQQRPHIQFYRQRLFSTRPPCRQLETTLPALQDDGFVPFEFSISKSAIGRRSPAEVQVADTGSSKEQSLIDAGDDDWHAEMEIAAPWPQETNSLGTVQSTSSELFIEAPGNPETGSAHPAPVDLEANHTTMDRVSLKNVVPLQNYDIPAVQVPLLPPETVTAAQKSRAQSRIERKLRRIEADKYRPLAEMQGETTSGSGVQSVLEKIEAMDESSTGTARSSKRSKRTGAPDANARNKLSGATVKTSRQKDERRKSVHEADTVVQPKGRRSMSASNAEKVKSATDAGGMNKAKDRRTKETPKPTEVKLATDSIESRRQKGQTSKRAPTPQPPTTPPKVKRELWQIQKGALEEKFGEMGWQPRKRLSPDTLDGIRALHASDPSSYTTATLSEHFQITPEAIRRILRSKWRPSIEEVDDRRSRWEKRGVKKWQSMAAQGVRPPAKWRAMGIRNVQDGPGQRSSARRKEEEYVQWAENSDAAEDEGSLVERIL